MKLAYISNSDIPSRSANSIHVMKMCSAFVKSGFEVELAAPVNNEMDFKSSDPFSFYGVEPNFEITRIPWYAKLPGKYFVYALMCAWWAVRSRADVIYGRYLFGVYFAAKMGKTVTLETHTDEFNLSRIHYSMIRYLAQSTTCKHIIVISEALRQAYVEEFPDTSSKMIVAHDGADPKPEFSSPSNKTFTVGYVGHLYKGKGMEIIEELVYICPEIHFLIVGGRQEDLVYWQEKLKDKKNAEFTGFVPHHQTNKYLAKMDVVLAPYLKKVFVKNGDIDISGWMSPLKIFEYMASGKPIIASDLPVIREVLNNRKNALLCDPDQPREWAEAIRYCQDHSDERTALGNQALNDFKASYSWKQRAERLKFSLI
ncbi:MAG: glycosyltransferase family 4 protein [Balneolaceae bacterium]